LDGGVDALYCRSVRVVVAEDSVLLREGITRVLENAGLEVVGLCGTGEELLSAVDLSPPDVAVIDIRMPPTYTDEGFRAAQEIRATHPETGVLVLSQYIEIGLALQLVADSAEGAGYLLKDRVSDVDEFAAAVRRVGEGGSAIDPSIVSQLLSRARDVGPVDRLTPKEREVLELMAQGRSNQAIAARLAITLRSAEKHVSSIFAKLGVATTGDDHRRVLAVLLYLRA
jgi:DNA-binding NarL/FixJ family response regulator